MNCVRNPRGMPSVVMLAVGSVEAPFSVEGIHAGKVVGSGGMEGGGAEVDASHSGRCWTRGVKGIAGYPFYAARPAAAGMAGVYFCAATFHAAASDDFAGMDAFDREGCFNRAHRQHHYRRHSTWIAHAVHPPDAS